MELEERLRNLEEQLARKLDERIPVFENLAKAARERFDSRRTYEWKMSFGIWTAFAIAAGFVVNAERWSPGCPECVLSFILAAGIVWVFCQFWLRDITKKHQSDNMTSYYWESAVEVILKRERPGGLRPKDWLRFKDEDNPKIEMETAPVQKWHKNYSLVTQAIITFALALLFFLAVLSKSLSSGDATSKVVIESSKSSKIAVDKVLVEPSKEGRQEFAEPTRSPNARDVPVKDDSKVTE